MASKPRTVIITGASQGIGAAVVWAFLDRDYNIVANSRFLTKSRAFVPSQRLALVDGDIGEAATAVTIAETAMSQFGSIDALVNNAGIFVSKPFTDYTADDFASLVATNLEGFIYISQLAIKQMIAQGNGGSIREYHDVDGGQSDRRVERVSGDDHQGRARGHHAQSGPGVCKGRHSS